MLSVADEVQLTAPEDAELVGASVSSTRSATFVSASRSSARGSAGCDVLAVTTAERRVVARKHADRWLVDYQRRQRTGVLDRSRAEISGVLGCGRNSSGEATSRPRRLSASKDAERKPITCLMRSLRTLPSRSTPDRRSEDLAALVLPMPIVPT